MNSLQQVIHYSIRDFVTDTNTILHIVKFKGGVSALSAGPYTATLYVMVDIVKGGAPPPSPFSLILPS